jgi:hypothetical protein
MSKKITAAQEIKRRISTIRVSAGLKTFCEVPTEQAKVEQLPLCNMVYGVDKIVKRSTRSASPSRAGMPNVRSAEIMLELIAPKSSNVVEIAKKVRDAVLSDIHPITNDSLTYMEEDRTEGPVGYGLPNIEAIILVIILIYPE